jgi:hypothetical protein
VLIPNRKTCPQTQANMATCGGPVTSSPGQGLSRDHLLVTFGDPAQKLSSKGTQPSQVGCALWF